MQRVGIQSTTYREAGYTTMKYLCMALLLALLAGCTTPRQPTGDGIDIDIPAKEQKK